MRLGPVLRVLAHARSLEKQKTLRLLVQYWGFCFGDGPQTSLERLPSNRKAWSDKRQKVSNYAPLHTLTHEGSRKRTKYLKDNCHKS